MKKIIIASIFMSIALVGYAQNQTLYEAIRLSANELNGTARFVGVGGAMGALGGDATSMAYNPAGLGIYRSSELTISGNIHWTNTSMGGQSPVNDITANLANVAYVGTWLNPKEKGLISLSFGIGYTRTKAFNKKSSYDGTQDYSITDLFAKQTNGINKNAFSKEPFLNNNIGWNSILAYETYMIDPIQPENPLCSQYISHYQQIGGGSVVNRLRLYETGSNDEFSLSIAGNVANIFYWGMSFNCDYAYYSKSINYYETFTADGKSLQHTGNYTMEASGFVYKLGVIVKPVNWLRIGAAFHTPTWYYMNDWYSGYAESNINPLKYTGVSNPIPGSGGTHITTPLKAMGSLGFLLGKYGFIGVDYQYSNYLGMDVEARNIAPEDAPNTRVLSTLEDTHTIRVGIEVKPIEALALRIGGGYTTPCTKLNASRAYYKNDTRMDLDYYNDKGNYNVTAGIGYRIGRHAIDLSYVWQVNESEFYPYAANGFDGNPITSSTAINQRSVRNQFILTYGIRF